MERRLNKYEGAVKWLGLCSLSLVFLVSCSTPTPQTDTASLDAPIDEVEELEEIIEEGNDPEIDMVDTGAPKDCVEEDERPACNVKPRGLSFIPLKILAEAGNRCLRPSGGSTRENVEIRASQCTNTKSVRWYKRQGVYGGGYKLENMNSGKCIERVGSRLRQRTCAGGGDAARNQTWAFRSTPPGGSGDFLKATMTDGSCMRKQGSSRVRMVNCQNDTSWRWYQSAF